MDRGQIWLTTEECLWLVLILADNNRADHPRGLSIDLGYEFMYMDDPGGSRVEQYIKLYLATTA